MSDLEKLAALAIECGFTIHRDLGPGLLESCYEVLLAASLARAGLAVERQKAVDIVSSRLLLKSGGDTPEAKAEAYGRVQSQIRPHIRRFPSGGVPGIFLREDAKARRDKLRMERCRFAAG